jgi:hypothetical protein
MRQRVAACLDALGCAKAQTVATPTVQSAPHENLRLA